MSSTGEHQQQSHGKQERQDKSDHQQGFAAKKRKNIRNEHFHQNTQHYQRLTGAPTWELPNLANGSDKKFTGTLAGRTRLFVANLPSNASEDSLRALFKPFGEISEVFLGKSNAFAFIKMDTRQNAENARTTLDGTQYEGKTLRVRLAAHAAAIRVKYLTPMVSNELLHAAFSTFGEVERAVVAADDRGRSLLEGVVEFARKSSAQAALKKCCQDCLLLTSSPIPVHVEPFESRDEEEGVSDRMLPRNSNEFHSERESGPRWAETGSLEWTLAQKWKQLAEIEKSKREQLEQEIKDARSQMMSQMECLRIEMTTKQLRDQLARMEQESQKLSTMREARIENERRREEERRANEMMLKQQEDALLRRHAMQDVGQLRHQENDLRQQATALQQLLDRQEAALRAMNDVNVNNTPSAPFQVPQLDPALFGHNPVNAQSPQMAPQAMAPPQTIPPQMRPHLNQFHGGMSRGGGGYFKRRRY